MLSIQHQRVTSFNPSQNSYVWQQERECKVNVKAG